MRTYVVDASVASRFLLVEDLSENAVLLLKSFLAHTVDLKAPELVTYEVGNTLWKAVRQSMIDVTEASEKFSYFLKLKLGSIELDGPDSIGALDWGLKNDATYYDSVYVMASKKTGGTLLTADQTLYDKASKEVSTFHLRHLKS